MCGFVGVLKLKDSQRDISEDLLQNMNRVLRHRGPDASSVYCDGACGLAHNRLSIIDLSDAGTQPMKNEDGRIWIAYNGEVYNFRTLRSSYGLDRNHKFRSHTDTEVLIHLYEELGPAFIRKLNGMYAFALWDRQKQALYLGRDPYGIKPLFYTIIENTLYFASEIKALLGIPGFEPGPSREGLFHYLSFDYMPGVLTAFENIYELLPGHLLTAGTANTDIRIERFFDIEYKINPSLTRRKAVENSLTYFNKAVERQLISDVPVGVMLSGGMDSSALTAMMAEVRGDSDFHTFSLKFNEKSFDESDYAQMVADHVGTTHHEILVTPEKVRNMLPKYLAYIDEPYADGSAIPTYLLAECARDFVSVLLSGEGGDEFFSGYDTHLAYKIRKIYRMIPRVIRQGLIRRWVKGLPVSNKKLSFDFKAKRFTYGAELDTPNSHFAWRAVLSEDLKQKVLSQESGPWEFAPSERHFEEAFEHCGAKDELNRLLYIDYRFHLPDDLMIKNDRMTMAHSIEARVPFTDNELVRFLASVPVRHKLPGKNKKYLLKASMEGKLPEPVLKKKKVGLEIPYSQWMRTDLNDLCEHTFDKKRLSDTGLFNGDTVSVLWKEHKEMKHDHGRFFWGLLNYMLWHETYIEKRNFTSYLSKPREPGRFHNATKT
ncbi:MAG: asparagine synthase (glutamine-hydrolyzing) [Spirochaetales bacterium]|nr:asparagine synthase (glutamine-hydrolyzing) [Spirochaetales bacterium]